MKNLLLLLIVLPLALQAQQSEEHYELDRTIPLPGKHAGGILQRAYNFTHRAANDFYIVNKGAETKYQVLGDSRMGYVNDMLGYREHSRPRGLVTAGGLFLYEPRDTSTCIKLLLIACDIEIRCVKGEADVTITKLRYCHYSRSGNDSTVLPIGNAALQTAGKGSYEQLLASDVCAEDIKALKVYVQQAGNELLERIADGMSGAIGADSKTNEADW